MASKAGSREPQKQKVLFLLRASLAEYLLYTKYCIGCLAQGLHLTSQEPPPPRGGANIIHILPMRKPRLLQWLAKGHTQLLNGKAWIQAQGCLTSLTTLFTMATDGLP